MKKVALVTGAYKGLGFEWCKQLGKIGYEVVLTARNIEQANEAALKLKEEGIDVEARALEVTNEQQLIELKNWLETRFGKVDLIINNAGVNPKDYADKSKMAKAFYLNDLDADEMLHVIHVNSIAPLLMVKHCRGLLNHSDSPVVINISSWLASVNNLSFGGHYGYVGSKNLLNVFNKSMALELKLEGIICVNVNPGWVQTDMGGKKANFTTEQAVLNILNQVISGLTMNDSGKFLNYDGSEHPW